MLASFFIQIRTIVAAQRLLPDRYDRQLAIRIVLFSVCWAALILIPDSQLAIAQVEPEDASPIVLRDLTLIRNKTIVNFDETSIELSDGTQLTWDQVLKASVGEQRQPEFDQNLKQIGLPLFRLKSRIGIGNWAGAGEIAEPLYVEFIAAATPSTDIDVSYLVCLATMKSRILNGDRIGALLPFVFASRLQPKISDSIQNLMGKRLIPQQDLDLGVSHELLPIWFDHSKLKESANQLIGSLEKLAESEDEQDVGIRLYLASIQIELGQTEQAQPLLRSLDSISNEAVRSWQTVLKARLHQKTKSGLNAQTMLDMNEKEIAGLARLAMLYFQGINIVDHPDTSDLDRSKATLTLLRIPALYGHQHRHLAAAAIYQSAEIARLRGRDADAQKLRDELLRRYPRTYHGLLEMDQRSDRR